MGRVFTCVGCQYKSNRLYNVLRHEWRIHFRNHSRFCCGELHYSKADYYAHCELYHPEARALTYISKEKYKITADSLELERFDRRTRERRESKHTYNFRVRSRYSKSIRTTRREKKVSSKLRLEYSLTYHGVEIEDIPLIFFVKNQNWKGSQMKVIPNDCAEDSEESREKIDDRLTDQETSPSFGQNMESDESECININNFETQSKLQSEFEEESEFPTGFENEIEIETELPTTFDQDLEIQSEPSFELPSNCAQEIQSDFQTVFEKELEIQNLFEKELEIETEPIFEQESENTGLENLVDENQNESEIPSESVSPIPSTSLPTKKLILHRFKASVQHEFRAILRDSNNNCNEMNITQTSTESVTRLMQTRAKNMKHTSKANKENVSTYKFSVEQQLNIKLDTGITVPHTTELHRDFLEMIDFENYKIF